MDLVFNFGEHYFNDSGSFWTDIVITVIGGFIGFGTALYFFYHQGQKDKKEEDIKLKNEQKDILVFFKQLIEGVISTIDKQTLKCQEFSDAVKSKPSENHPLKVIASKEIDRL
jgi:hypothetical protein